jgi:hypothetical protein
MDMYFASAEELVIVVFFFQFQDTVIEPIFIKYPEVHVLSSMSPKNSTSKYQVLNFCFFCREDQNILFLGYIEEIFWLHSSGCPVVAA